MADELRMSQVLPTIRCTECRRPIAINEIEHHVCSSAALRSAQHSAGSAIGPGHMPAIVESPGRQPGGATGYGHSDGDEDVADDDDEQRRRMRHDRRPDADLARNLHSTGAPLNSGRPSGAVHPEYAQQQGSSVQAVAMRERRSDHEDPYARQHAANIDHVHGGSSDAAGVLGRLNSVRHGALDDPALRPPPRNVRNGQIVTKSYGKRTTVVPLKPRAANRQDVPYQQQQQQTPSTMPLVVGAAKAGGRFDQHLITSLAQDQGPYGIAGVSSRIDEDLFVAPELQNGSRPGSSRSTRSRLGFPHKSKKRDDDLSDDGDVEGEVTFFAHQPRQAHSGQQQQLQHRPSSRGSHRSAGSQVSVRTTHSSESLRRPAQAPQAMRFDEWHAQRQRQVQQNGGQHRPGTADSNASRSRQQQQRVAPPSQATNWPKPQLDTRPDQSVQSVQSDGGMRARYPDHLQPLRPAARQQGQLQVSHASQGGASHGHGHRRHETASSSGTRYSGGTDQSLQSTASSMTSRSNSEVGYVPKSPDEGAMSRTPLAREHMPPVPLYRRDGGVAGENDDDATPRAGQRKAGEPHMPRSDTTGSFDRLVRDLSQSLGPADVHDLAPPRLANAVDASPSSNYSPVQAVDRDRERERGRDAESRPSTAATVIKETLQPHAARRLGSPASLRSRETTRSANDQLDHSRSSSTAPSVTGAATSISAPVHGTRPTAAIDAAKPPSAKGKPVHRCRGCDELVVGKSLSSKDGKLSGRYHRQCFVCTLCRSPFREGEFYVIHDRPYCKQHYHERNGTQCQACGQGIEGECYAEGSRRWHKECYASKLRRNEREREYDDARQDAPRARSQARQVDDRDRRVHGTSATKASKRTAADLPPLPKQQQSAASRQQALQHRLQARQRDIVADDDYRRF